MPSETPKNSSGRDDLALVQACVLVPPLRCFHREPSTPSQVCGELATHARFRRWWYGVEYFCDAHRLPSDEPIAPVFVFRRVRVSCDILLAGTSVNPVQAQAEAVARLERAVQAAGGLLDVERVISSVVKSSPQRLQRGDFRPDFDRE